MTSVAALAALLSASQGGAPSPSPVELLRVFKAGEVMRYQVRSLLVTETQRIGMPFMQPNDLEINYDSSLQISALKADGFATALYKRPTMDIVLGETAERDRVTNKEKSNINLELSLSPINEITGVKDLNAKPAAPPPRRTGGALWMSAAGAAPAPQVSIPFVQDLYRLSLYVGSLDAAIDLNPPLPYEEVKTGATWRKTATYQPQALRGRPNAKMAVQRLDWTYRYEGVVEVKGRKVHRVTGVLALDTDVAKFANQEAGATAGQTGLEAIPLKMTMNVSYDLDLATRKTLAASSEAKGSWSVKLTAAEEPVLEEKFTGRTTLTLASG